MVIYRGKNLLTIIPNCCRLTAFWAPVQIQWFSSHWVMSTRCFLSVILYPEVEFIHEREYFESFHKRFWILKLPEVFPFCRTNILVEREWSNISIFTATWCNLLRKCHPTRTSVSNQFNQFTFLLFNSIGSIGHPISVATVLMRWGLENRVFPQCWWEIISSFIRRKLTVQSLNREFNFLHRK